MMIPARSPILRSSLAMKGYGFPMALAVTTDARGAGALTTGAADRVDSCAAALAEDTAGAVPCRIMARLFLL